MEIDDDLEDEDEEDGDNLDYESTDSMTSAHQLSGGYILSSSENKSSYLIKRSSSNNNNNNNNTVFYNAKPCLSHQVLIHVSPVVIIILFPVHRTVVKVSHHHLHLSLELVSCLSWWSHLTQLFMPGSAHCSSPPGSSSPSSSSSSSSSSSPCTWWSGWRSCRTRLTHQSWRTRPDHLNNCLTGRPGSSLNHPRKYKNI